ncbi:MAG: NUDIX domain-containing protein [Acidobacteria bacterium]|nr:NUDIX domain-containing protein [Acidobacteriota bacterium]
MESQVVIGLNAVIVAVTGDTPRILTVRRERASPAGDPAGRETGGWQEAIPSGPLDPSGDRTLELGLRRWVREQTGLGIGYVEQLYTFGDRNRDPLESSGGPRVISVAYLALVREGKPSGAAGADWRDWYRFFPWEDWRGGPPAVIGDPIGPALERWVRQSPDRRTQRERRERGDIHFGLRGAPWVPERVLERYELIYEIGLAVEAFRDRGPLGTAPPSGGERRGRRDGRGRQMGQPLALDHRRILATALGRLRGKLNYRPVVFELLPAEFTLLQLQRVLESLAGVRLHKQNLRRLVEKGGLVEGTGRLDPRTGGRPAELFRFRRDVLRERPAPGVGLPGIRHGA